jgi:hypothetical protein
MAVSAFNPSAGAAGIVVTRRKPGHFVVLTEDGRIDAILAQSGVKLPDALEKRAAINVNSARQGPNDGSSLSPASGVKNVDPYDVMIAMPAQDGEPVVSDADREAWSKWRVAYNVTIEAPTFPSDRCLIAPPVAGPVVLDRARHGAFPARFRALHPVGRGGSD